MGVKHAREYADILVDLTEAVAKIPDCYEFFEMTSEEWERLSGEDRKEVLEALADDVFYGLGEHTIIQVGSSEVTYDAKFHLIDVSIGDQILAMVKLT
ncbi:hypothetical protein BVG16_28135 [Paenibacillus selenitireducens]|jgi:hypothetical protein|uniref:Uncharacterized protein n=1 Tax=Paenibacillus selenitireducens TaxID=1324314 RepID=A0A1T2X0X3_9BACL|nr:hypothetical protein [Paenibacillus selenitireducens]OPA73502.1 hypothetical protein BVG16_28135 [Paenibacillus selenitireducens]